MIVSISMGMCASTFEQIGQVARSLLPRLSNLHNYLSPLRNLRQTYLSDTTKVYGKVYREGAEVQE